MFGAESIAGFAGNRCCAALPKGKAFNFPCADNAFGAVQLPGVPMAWS